MHQQRALDIFRRHWIPIVFLPILVGIFSLFIQLRQPISYHSTARLMITQTPHRLEQVGAFPDFNLINSWQSSEYIIDDMPQVINSLALAEDISLVLKQQGDDIAPLVIQSALSAQTFHRSVTISSHASSPEIATKIIAGAIISLQTNGLKYWNRSRADENGLSVALLNPAGQATPSRTFRTTLRNVGLRVVLALFAGLGLALLLHYLDNRIRDSHQVEEMIGISVIGTIPKE